MANVDKKIRINLVIGEGSKLLFDELFPIAAGQRAERLRTLAHLGILNERGAPRVTVSARPTNEPPALPDNSLVDSDEDDAVLSGFLNSAMMFRRE